MAPPISLLVVTSAPDARGSTATLRLLVHELRDRPEVEVSVWFLRADPDQVVWPGARVVDDLRTWRSATVADRWATTAVGDRVRGLGLRSWWRSVSPQAVLLDDGIGARVVTGGHAATIVRLNAEPPGTAAAGEAVAADADLVLHGPGAADPFAGDVARLAAGPLAHLGAARAAAEPQARTRWRSVLRLPTDAPLVVGWGAPGAPEELEAFARALALVHEQVPDVHGVWLAAEADPAVHDQARSRHAELGLAGRLHERPVATLEARCAGDAVLLPGSTPVADLVVESVAAGLTVVVGAAVDGLHDPSVVLAQGPRAQADALVAALAADRTEASRGARERLDVAGFADGFVSALASIVAAA